MNQLSHILGKEFKDYFISPIAYIVISIFLLVTGWLFFTTFFLYNQAMLRNFFNLLPLVFAFVIPAITMRLFAEELNIGSYEILLTMPVRFTDIILGKFFGGLLFVMTMLLPTISYAITVALIGDLDWGPVIGGYLGAVLLGAAYTAIGIFASSLTRNQIIAFIIGTAICFTLSIIDKMLYFFPQTLLGVINYLGADYHFQNIAKGVVDSRDILYFVSVCFIGLYGTHISMQEKI
ncbi:MAG: ABC transporter permease subunit [Desulfobacterales bacterium]|nr:ABC transporter permease subunit [Desulfobacterales bacterium]